MIPKHRVLDTYRVLLRSVSRHVTAVNQSTLWRDYIAAEFRKNAGISDPQAAATLLETAEGYAKLLEDVQAHKELLISYNISVDKGKRRQDHLRRTALRVGLNMPDVREPAASPRGNNDEI